jgi:hypothetical protein
VAKTRLEAVLQAWSECSPEGQVAELDVVVERLPKVSACIQGVKASIQSQRLRRELFQAATDPSTPYAQRTFIQRLNAEGGEVHFLYFWRAFSEVSRLVEAVDQDLEELPLPTEVTGDLVKASSSRPPRHDMREWDDALASELETFRDKALGLLRVRIPKKELVKDLIMSTPLCSSKIAMSALRDAVRKASLTPVASEFWQVSAASLSDYDGLLEITLEQLTTIMLAWLDNVITGQWDTGTDPHQGPLTTSSMRKIPATKCLARKSTLSSDSATDIAHLSLGKSSARWHHDADNEGKPVYLNIYDAFRDKNIQWFNSLLAPEESKWRLGGAFHTGVEVNGMEWSYGCSADGQTGVAWNLPKNHKQHSFRQAIRIGYTQLSQDLIMDVLTDLCEEYCGEDYHMLRHNCCHFADDFCQRLAVGGIPTWVHRLARICSKAEGYVHGFGRGISSCSCTNQMLEIDKDDCIDDDQAHWLYRL